MPKPTVRFRIDFNRDESIGPGKIALLERIGQSGSLSQAARDLDMSYRRAWQLLASANTAFLEKVALTAKGGRGGGGAKLTPFGHELINSYRAFEKDVQAQAARHFRLVASHTRKLPTHKLSTRKPAAPTMRLSDR
jgi:molybdate transport system regulatory protein